MSLVDDPLYMAELERRLAKDPDWVAKVKYLDETVNMPRRYARRRRDELLKMARRKGLVDAQLLAEEERARFLRPLVYDDRGIV